MTMADDYLESIDDLRTRVAELEAESAELRGALLQMANAGGDQIAAIEAKDSRISTLESELSQAKGLVLDAFDFGYAWRSQLTGQVLEDSRAVGRTLLSDMFVDAGVNVDVAEWDSFTTADIAICEGKRRIKSALITKLRTAAGETVREKADG